jgi:hypothetical protein
MYSFNDDEDDWAEVATTVLRKDGYAISSLKHPREKLLESSLRFLQLLCENHNLEMQVHALFLQPRNICTRNGETRSS